MFSNLNIAYLCLRSKGEVHSAQKEKSRSSTLNSLNSLNPTQLSALRLSASLFIIALFSD